MSTVVSAFIQELRQELGDIPQQHVDSIEGTSDITAYETKFKPIIEGSYSLTFETSALTEGSANDYTLDKDTGHIALTSGLNGTLEMQYKSANFRDQWWLNLVKSTIQDLGDQYFRTVVRSPSSIALSAGVRNISLPSNCIMLTEVFKTDTGTSAGVPIPLGVNSYFDRRSKKLVLGAAPLRDGYLEISFLRQLAIPTATTSTLDLEDQWLTMVKDGAAARYCRAYAAHLSQQGNVSVEEGHLSIQGLRQMARDYESKYQEAKRRLKPIRPNTAIPFYIHGGGHVQRI